MVGQSQGQRTARTCSRAASSAWTTSACSTGRPCLPPGFRLEESDATSWMAFYCLSMLEIAVELARIDQVWDDIATKFLEHFLSIALAMRSFGTTEVSLWDDEDGFFYDVLVHPDGSWQRMRVRSMAGLLPILAAANAPAWVADELPDFTSRLRWLMMRRPELLGGLAAQTRATGRSRQLSAVAARRARPAPDSGPDVRRGRVPLAARHPVAVGDLPHGRTRKRSTARPARSTTSRGNRRTRCSAATRTGAGRSGSR